MHRRADRGGKEDALAKLVVAVEALEKAVGAAKVNLVAAIAIREAQLLLTRARATARLKMAAAAPRTQ